MLSGADIVRYSRCLNALFHNHGQPTVADLDRLGQTAEDFEALMGLSTHDFFELAAISACSLADQSKDKSPIFEKCSLRTAANLAEFILHESGFRRKEDYSDTELSDLRESLQSGNYGIVAQLLRAKWQ